MKAEERIEQLEAEVAVLKDQLAQALARIQELEGQQAKDSHNSSKPPSSDGFARKTKSLRKPSGKKSGGQPHHQGHHCQLIEKPDQIVRHRPACCQQCQQGLEQVPGEVVERRQVHELAAQRLVVTEHQLEQGCCPHCQMLTSGSFPLELKAPVQYGNRLRALAVYLHEYQFLPMKRTCTLLAQLWGCHVSQGTLLCWSQQASETLEPTVEQIASYLRASPLQHADETGVRLSGKLHWVHVNSTHWLTHLAWHAKRGRQALEAIGIWPQFAGRAMHDRWKSYDGYECEHSVCAAHLLRDLTYVAEHEQQSWAAEMKELLLDMHEASVQWRQRGASALPLLERQQWQGQYFELLASGFAVCAQAPPQSLPGTKERGRRKQSAAKNLLDDLLRRARQVLAFLDDLSLPFTNNQAERDLRMVKVQQKVAGTFRSEEGVSAFCHIYSYLSTMHKQGHVLLEALTAVFAGRPFPVAWGI